MRQFNLSVFLLHSLDYFIEEEQASMYNTHSIITYEDEQPNIAEVKKPGEDDRANEEEKKDETKIRHVLERIVKTGQFLVCVLIFWNLHAISDVSTVVNYQAKAV